MFYQNAVRIGLACGVLALAGCQTVPTVSKNTLPTDVNSDNLQQNKQLLSNAISKTLYQNQTWISEHQIFLKNQPSDELKTDDVKSDIKSIETCQNTHDKKFVTQMKADKLTAYADIATLDESQQQIYQKIKQDYLDCYQSLDVSDDEPKTDYLVDTVTKPSKTDKETAMDTNTDNDNPDDTLTQDISDLNEIMQTIGFSKAQINSLNQFMLKSGKITMTGSYHPFAGFVATQIDAGFENKNLKYHYRFPMVADWKKQAIYVKPDIFMPSIALYLDNQMGMSWQDKWYKFDTKNDQHIPTDMTVKAWATAIKQSFDDLPNSQFRTIDSVLLMPNITYATQKIAKNGTVIKWQQTAKEQDRLYQDVVERFIQTMDKNMQNPKYQAHQDQWQTYKIKLNDYLENRLAIEPDENNRLTGQQFYFVVLNNQLKQIFAQNTATSQGQAYQLNTWITFNPDESLIKPINQPKTLDKLVSQIDEKSNVIDGKSEIERLMNLDKSRRLFGKEPEWLKYLGKIANIEPKDDDDELY